MMYISKEILNKLPYGSGITNNNSPNNDGIKNFNIFLF